MAPQRYELLEYRAGLSGLPVRATLKQLEGYWAGELPGTLRADLAVESGFIPTAESWIENRLGVDLTGCWLIGLRDIHALTRHAVFDRIGDVDSSRIRF